MHTEGVSRPSRLLAWTMLSGSAVALRQQVIVAVPDSAERRCLTAWLEAEGYEAVQRSTAEAASHEIAGQPFDLLVVDCSFVLHGGVRGYGLSRFRETPMVILGDSAGGRLCAHMAAQMIYVERPFTRAMFICMVTMALMDRRAERRTPRRTVRPLDAMVNGVWSRILDVSKEGVRLELPRSGSKVTQRLIMRVPRLGIGVALHPVWVRMPRADEHTDVMWCGGQLSQNSSSVEQSWSGFVDALTPDPSSSHSSV